MNKNIICSAVEYYQRLSPSVPASLHSPELIEKQEQKVSQYFVFIATTKKRTFQENLIVSVLC